MIMVMRFLTEVIILTLLVSKNISTVNLNISMLFQILMSIGLIGAELMDYALLKNQAPWLI